MIGLVIMLLGNVKKRNLTIFKDFKWDINNDEISNFGKEVLKR